MYPELVHASKYGRVLNLKNVPKTKISRCLVVGESASITLNDRTVDFEAEKLKMVLPQKGTDCGKGKLMFLNVK